MDTDTLKLLAEESLRINGCLTYEMSAQLIDAVADTSGSKAHLQDAHIDCEGMFEDILSVLRKINVRGDNKKALDSAIKELEDVASELLQMCEHTNECVESAINCL